MNSEHSAAAPNFQINPQGSETELRRQLTEMVAGESVGTVGIYTSADFDYKEKDNIAAALQRRNPGRRLDRMSTGGGYGNYGERTVYESASDPLAGSLRELSGNHEELHAQELPDGVVDFRYGFMSQGMNDGMGRPGNRLVMGFLLPAESAKAFMAAIEADPSLINDTVEQLALGCGVTEEYWEKRMKPRYGMNDWKEDKDRILTVFRHDATAAVREQAKLSYAQRQPLKDALERALSAPGAAAEAEEKPSVYGQYAAEAQQMIEDFKEAGAVYTLGGLAGLGLEVDQEFTHKISAGAATDRDKLEAVGACTNTYRGFLQEQYRSGGDVFLRDYIRQVVEKYYQMADWRSGAEPDDPFDVNPMADTETTIADTCAYELDAIDQALAILEPSPDPALVVRIVEQVKSELGVGGE